MSDNLPAARMSTFTCVSKKGVHVIFTPSGNAARTTSGDVFQTTDAALAEESLAYLIAKEAHRGLSKLIGSNRMKSMWETI